jgi:Flavin reductase like domain
LQMKYGFTLPLLTPASEGELHLQTIQFLSIQYTRWRAQFLNVFVPPLHRTLAGFSVGRRRGGAKKDTLVNIEFSGDFVINVVTEAISRPMNQAAGDYPSHVDEFKEAGLTPVASDLVRPPRVAESPVQIVGRPANDLPKDPYSDWQGTRKKSDLSVHFLFAFVFSRV